MNVVAAVLAAGSSRRLGSPKQLLPLPDGRSLIRKSAQAVLASRARRAAVIVGAHAVPIMEHLRGLPLDFVGSEDHREGLAASIRAAAAWASAQRADALLICLCDQPALDTPHVDALLNAWSAHDGLVASHYAEKRAVPAVFPAQHFAELRALGGDVGAASMLKAARHITLVPWAAGALDVDTAEDWQRVSALRPVR